MVDGVNGLHGQSAVETLEKKENTIVLDHVQIPLQQKEEVSVQVKATKQQHVLLWLVKEVNTFQLLCLLSIKRSISVEVS